MTQKSLRVCYFGTYRANYTRNQIMINGLRQQGVTVYECHSTLWRGIQDRVDQASGGWRNPRFFVRVAAAYWQLLRAHWRTPTYDVMLIGYPGQFDAYLGRILAWWRRKPMALDTLMSLYLVAEERGLTEKSPFTAKLIYALEKVGLSLPDLLVAENSAYEAYFRTKFHIDEPGRFWHVPHGADNGTYAYRPHLHSPAGRFDVLYHGTYLPSHGLETIVQAAVLLREFPDIHFNFYGKGQERGKIEVLVAELGLENVTFHGWVEMGDLLDAMAQAHVCMGVFGTTKQSYNTIQNKVWEGMAMRRPVISGDSDTVRESLTHLREIYLIAREDPRALADAILALRAEPDMREAIAQNAYDYYIEHNAPQAIGRTMEAALRSLLG